MIRISFSNTRKLEITECEWKDIQVAIRTEQHSYGCFDGAEIITLAAQPLPAYSQASELDADEYDAELRQQSKVKPCPACGKDPFKNPMCEPEASDERE